MKIYLMRHGQTDLNVQKRLQGSSEIPLNDRGRFQATETRKFLEENGINVTKMKGIIVYCPSISSQQKFKTILGQADKSKYLS